MDEDKLIDFLRDIQLDQFSEAIIDRLHVTRLSHFIHVEDSDLEDIGMSKPEIRRLFETLKRARRKGTLLSRLRKSFRRHSDRRPVISTSNSSTSISSTLTMRDSSPKREEKQRGLKCLIQECNIELEEFLGRGAFGYVRKGIWDKNGKKIEVAVKCLKEGQGDDSLQSQNEFIKEANSMSLLDHPYLVRLYGVVLSAPMMLVAELAPLGSLLTRLREEPEKFKVSTICRFVIQIVTGMQYLESQRYVHRDLAARNILLLTYDQIKIGDFGLMRALPGDAEYYIMQPNGRVPFAWCAPECLKYRKFSHQSDVWAFGVTLFELFSHGCEPWPGLNGSDILEKIDEPNFERPECPLACPALIYQIVRECCWCHEAEDRLTFAELLNVLSKAIPSEAIAIRDYAPTDANELNFNIGDSITIINGGEPKLTWLGRNERTMKIGNFPSMFVKKAYDGSAQENEVTKDGHFKSYVERENSALADMPPSTVSISGTSPNRMKTDPLPSSPMSQNVLNVSIKHRHLRRASEEIDSASVYSRSSCSSSNSDSSSLSGSQRMPLHKRNVPSRSSLRSKASVSSAISSGAVSAGSSYKEETESCSHLRQNRPISSCSDYASQDESQSRRSSFTISVNQYEEIDRRLPTSTPIAIPGGKSLGNRNCSMENSPADSAGSIDASCSCHCRLDVDEQDLQPRSRKRSQQLTRPFPTSRSNDSFSGNSNDGQDTVQRKPRTRKISSQSQSFKEKWEIPSSLPKSSLKVSYSMDQAYEDMTTLRRHPATACGYEIMAMSLPISTKPSNILSNRNLSTPDEHLHDLSYENIGSICKSSSKQSYENFTVMPNAAQSHEQLSNDQMVNSPSVYDNHQLEHNIPSPYENHHKFIEKQKKEVLPSSVYQNCDLNNCKTATRSNTYENQRIDFPVKSSKNGDKTPPLPIKKSASLKRNTSSNCLAYENCAVENKASLRFDSPTKTPPAEIEAFLGDKSEEIPETVSAITESDTPVERPIAPPRKKRDTNRRNTYAGKTEIPQPRARAKSALLSPRWEAENARNLASTTIETHVPKALAAIPDPSLANADRPRCKQRSYSCDDPAVVLRCYAISENLKSLLLCGSVQQQQLLSSYLAAEAENSVNCVATSSSFPNLTNLNPFSSKKCVKRTEGVNKHSVLQFITTI